MSTSQASLSWRLLLPIAIAIVLIAALARLPPMAQPLAYHQFADQRSFLGIPRFFDVASNFAFLVVGLLGLRLLARRPTAAHVAVFVDEWERLPYVLFFLGVTFTCFGSIYYHLAPDNQRLAWDRLPMAVGFTAFLAAIVTERIGVRAGVWLLLPLVGVGIGSVGFWRWSEAQGVENLLPYLAVQGYCLLASLVLIGLFPSRYTHGRLIVMAVMLYAGALICEQLDRMIFSAGAVVSGHTLKHLLAAAAIYQLCRMLRDRRPACA